MAEELNNPLFEDEREFLERKKQEYERALRGDVEHIKEQGVQVGKVAAVGAGLAGSIWLISKAFGGKSKRRKSKKQRQSYDDLISLPDQDDDLISLPGSHGQDDFDSPGARDTRYGFDDDNEFELDDEAFALDRSAEFRGGENSFREESGYGQHDDYSRGAHSARESAQVFMAHDDQQPDAYDHDDNLDQPGRQNQYEIDQDNQGFDNGFGGRADTDDLPQGRLDFGPAVHQHKQGYDPAHAQSLAYDDSRRLPESEDFSADNSADEFSEEEHSQPASHAHDADVPWPSAESQQGKGRNSSTLGKRVGGALMSFLGTDTGKAVAAQATAAVLAYVTKKINDRQPRPATVKNADLADAPATTTYHATSPSATATSPAVSLTYTDAPTEHPAS